ncbi:uncharacterized protein TRAVEDRAFT_48128 [Trametes versicolor FP-101664 SS1]|uniref:uncharacterized protein n=1 Tax=Trametes versicolor (strain FP-101664) TaxID=717944 RepID=UPI0004624372|nr:uncharacterized protein TRAVEDRAFT_48128 [Trametes versicolor FP-101664 SS1]EIW58998.1 hypothetical protein TRAVEDRAFT_48128 [Trametes versicolor FP-101664 SS1]
MVGFQDDRVGLDCAALDSASGPATRTATPFTPSSSMPSPRMPSSPSMPRSPSTTSPSLMPRSSLPDGPSQRSSSMPPSMRGLPAPSIIDVIPEQPGGSTTLPARLMDPSAKEPGECGRSPSPRPRLYKGPPSSVIKRCLNCWAWGHSTDTFFVTTEPCVRRGEAHDVRIHNRSASCCRDYPDSDQNARPCAPCCRNCGGKHYADIEQSASTGDTALIAAMVVPAWLGVPTPSPLITPLTSSDLTALLPPPPLHPYVSAPQTCGSSTL